MRTTKQVRADIDRASAEMDRAADNMEHLRMVTLQQKLDRLYLELDRAQEVESK